MTPEDDDWLAGQMLLPEPYREFKANLLRYALSAGLEALPLDEEEGNRHMPRGLCIWECQDPEVAFQSVHFMVYIQVHGG